MTFHRNICTRTDNVVQRVELSYRICRLCIASSMAILSLISMSCLNSLATTYYVDASAPGGDGLSEATAWNALVNVSQWSFVAGDRIQFKRGETFFGQLEITSNGVEGNPIVFEAYGDLSQALPVIDGSQSLDGWTDEGHNVYSFPRAAAYIPNVVYYRGMPKPPITTLSFTSVPSEIGAHTVLLQDAPYSSFLVTSVTGQTVSGITFFPISESAQAKYRYLQNGLEQEGPFFGTPTLTTTHDSLTEPGHWYWDNNFIYLYSEELPTGSTVSFGFKDYGIWVKTSHDVIIQDIMVRNTNGRGVYLSNSSNITVQRVNVYGGGVRGENGIQLWNASNNTIQNNIIDSVLSTAISLYADPGSVSADNTIRNNTVSNTAGAGISLSSAEVYGNTLFGNTISSANALSYDGAGVYSFSAGSNTIQANSIRNCGSEYLRSAGIMVDMSVAAMTITGNVIENNSKGGIAVSGNGHQITNNTLRNNGASSWINAEIIFFTAGTPASNCTVTGNSMEADHDHHFVYVNGDNASGHTINNNTYRGLSTQQFYWPDQWLDFAAWNSVSGHDADSVLNPPSPAPAPNPPADFSLNGIYLLL